MLAARIVTDEAVMASLLIQGRALSAEAHSELTFHQLDFARLWFAYFNAADGGEGGDFGDKRGRNFMGQKSFQEKALYAIATDGDRLVGIAPLVVTRVERKGKPSMKVLGFCADSVQVFYQDLLISPEHREAAVTAMLDALCAYVEAEGLLLFLGYLPKTSANLPYLARGVEKRLAEGWTGGIAVTQSRGGVYPWNIHPLCKVLGQLREKIGEKDAADPDLAVLGGLMERLEQQTSALLLFGATRNAFDKEARALAEKYGNREDTREIAAEIVPSISAVLIKYPYLDLPATREEYQESLSSSKRYWFRRYLKKYEEAGGSFEVIEPGSLTDADVDDYLRLHTERWGKDSIAVNAVTLGFHRELVMTLSKAGSFRLFFARQGDRRLAAHACFDIAGRREYFFGGRTLDSEELRAGKLLVMHTLLDAIDRGYKTYDFGYGGDEYKADFTKAHKHSRNVFLCKDASLFDPEGLFAKYEQMNFDPAALT